VIEQVAQTYLASLRELVRRSRDEASDPRPMDGRPPALVSQLELDELTDLLESTDDGAQG
jgi:hypothetical protein